MREGTNRDWRWSDRYIDSITRCISWTFGEDEKWTTVAPPAEDQDKNTDLILLTSNGWNRIACRIRCAGSGVECFCGKRHFPAWPNCCNEFTIRATRPTGTKTELEKIFDGFGNFLFYGFGGKDGRLVYWTVANLDIFRRVHKFGRLQGNHDGSSEFYIYRWIDFPNEFIVQQHRRQLG